MKSYLLLISILSFTSCIYPIALFHGIVDSCKMKNTSTLVNDLQNDLGVHVECIEIGNGFMDSVVKPIWDQVEEACEKIKNNPNFQGKFSILGISQGTLIGRYIIEKCDIKGQVINYMSFDGPQMGIASIPKITCGSFCEWLCNITAPLAYKLTTYQETNTFLKMLNNEDERDEEVYRRFSSLEKVKLIKSLEDTVITPRDSSWFEFYDKEGKDIVPLKESEFYINDNIGLRKLDEEGKVSFVAFKEEHVLYNKDEYRNEIVKFFKD